MIHNKLNIRIDNVKLVILNACKTNVDMDRRKYRGESLVYARQKLAPNIMKKRKMKFRLGKWSLEVEEAGKWEFLIIIAVLTTLVFAIIWLFSK